MPKTNSLKFGYADDFAIAHQHHEISSLEQTLGQDTEKLQSYFEKWFLKMNTTKTTSALYHLDNHKANHQLAIQTKNSILPFDPLPKYIGVTLDRTLSFKHHLENTAIKLRKRNGIIKKIAGTTWGASANVLRTSSLALSYSVAEYCAPVWSRSHHTQKVDTLTTKWFHENYIRDSKIHPNTVATSDERALLLLLTYVEKRPVRINTRDWLTASITHP